jgi:hypothetical protein
MSTSKLVTVGLAVAIAVTTGGLIVQHNHTVQKEEARPQAATEQASAADLSKQREIRAASPQELPDVVVSAPRYVASR